MPPEARADRCPGVAVVHRPRSVSRGQAAEPDLLELLLSELLDEDPEPGADPDDEAEEAPESAPDDFSDDDPGAESPDPLPDEPFSVERLSVR